MIFRISLFCCTYKTCSCVLGKLVPTESFALSSPVFAIQIRIAFAFSSRKWRGEAKVHPLPSQAQTEEARIEGS